MKYGIATGGTLLQILTTWIFDPFNLGKSKSEIIAVDVVEPIRSSGFFLMALVLELLIPWGCVPLTIVANEP